jgi:hypothetical protein
MKRKRSKRRNIDTALTDYEIKDLVSILEDPRLVSPDGRLALAGVLCSIGWWGNRQALRNLAAATRGVLSRIPKQARVQ